MIYDCSGNLSRVLEWTCLIWLQSKSDDIRALCVILAAYFSNSLGHLLSGMRGRALIASSYKTC